jgi:hypothetical protein
MKILPAAIAAAATGALALICACSSLGPLAGGGTTVENSRVIGTAVDTAGYPLARVRAQLLPVLYDPVADAPLPDSLSDTTDAAGRYSITTSLSGVFNMEATHPATQRKALVTAISIGSEDSVFARTAMVTNTGSIILDLGNPSATANAYVYLPGTTLFSAVMNGIATLRAVPAGAMPAVYFKKYNDPYSLMVIKTNVMVPPGGTVTIIDLHSWRSSKKLVLNTTASGADVGATETDFPVLVRLNAGNFAFNQAQADGSDIRFTKSDDTPLPFEIEAWDSAAGAAAIWVRVDTVYGNNGTQSMTMHWGNPAAQSVSNSAAVFDTAADYKGVWHLNNSPVVNTASMKDATAGRCDGTPRGSILPADLVGGIIGKAVHFNGVDARIKIKRPVQDDFSICFWMLADSAGLQHTAPDWWHGNGLVDGDRPDTNWGDFGVSFLNNMPSFGIGQGIDSTLSSGVAVNDNQWHFVAVTRARSSGARAIYVDGRLAGSDIASTQSLTTKDSLAFGSLGSDHRPYDGKLDEIVISRIVRSSDWIKLSYMNQRTGDRLVVFK